MHVLALANVGIGEERVARKMVHKAMVQVCYLSIRTLNGTVSTKLCDQTVFRYHVTCNKLL